MMDNVAAPNRPGACRAVNQEAMLGMLQLQCRMRMECLPCQRGRAWPNSESILQRQGLASCC